MTGELRALGVAHGLLLGLAIACSWRMPELMPASIDALLMIGGFQLRLADRRFTVRSGPKEWVSHIAMAPTRLVRWAAAAMVALIAGDVMHAQAVLLAAIACELCAYRVVTIMIGRRALHWAAGATAMLIVSTGLTDLLALHLILCFVTGVTACLVWLRGPDGEPRALALALGGGGAAIVAMLIFPGALAFAAPTLTVCMAWALAHLSVWRRPLMPWRTAMTPSRWRSIPLRTRLR